MGANVERLNPYKKLTMMPEVINILTSAPSNNITNKWLNCNVLFGHAHTVIQRHRYNLKCIVPRSRLPVVHFLDVSSTCEFS